MLKKIIHICITVLNVLFVILSIALLLISIFKKEWFVVFIEWMKIEIQWLWYWNYSIVFLSSCIEAFPVLWVLLPGQNILLIVGWFFGDISYNHLIYVIYIASFWAIVWNYIWFLLGRYFGDSFFDKYWIWVWIWRTEVKYLKKWIDKWWAFWITIGKFHPITRSFLPFIAGSMGMKSGKFMLYNAIGSFIRSSTIIVLWVVFVKYYKILLEHSGTISIIIFWIIWWYIYKYKRKEFKKYWEEKNLEMEEMSKK
jgi:membrane protein DedA with SNARE-associated domain